MKKILIPIDGSEDSLEGIRLFKDLNIVSNNEIFILNVQNITVPYDNYFTIANREGLLGYLNEQGEKILEKARAILPGEKYTTAVKIGDPVTEIINYAENINADLIVVGSHGKSGLSKVLMGSVTSKLLAYSSIPVLITRPKIQDKEKLKTSHSNLNVD